MSEPDGLTLLVGTKKGVFFLSGSANRDRFSMILHALSGG